MRGGAPQVQRGGEFSNFHLASVARENFQHARQPVNDLNRRARPITVFLARFRVGNDFGAMIQLRDAARIVGRTNIIHSFFMMSRPARLCEV